jgi:glycogen synthase
VLKKVICFVFVGRLVGDKGINELISTFGNFLQEQQNKLVGWSETN